MVMNRNKAFVRAKQLFEEVYIGPASDPENILQVTGMLGFFPMEQLKKIEMLPLIALSSGNNSFVFSIELIYRTQDQKARTAPQYSIPGFFLDKEPKCRLLDKKKSLSLSDNYTGNIIEALVVTLFGLPTMEESQSNINKMLFYYFYLIK